MDKNSANKIHFRTSPVGAAGTRFGKSLRCRRKTKRRKPALALPVWRHGRISGWRRFSREKNRGNRAVHLAGEMPPGIGVTRWVALGRGFLPGSDWIYIAGGIYLAKTTGDVSMGRRPCKHSRCVLPTQYNGFPGGKIHEKFGKSDETSA